MTLGKSEGLVAQSNNEGLQEKYQTGALDTLCLMTFDLFQLKYNLSNRRRGQRSCVALTEDLKTVQVGCAETQLHILLQIH